MDVVTRLGVRIEMHWPLFSIGTLKLNTSRASCGVHRLHSQERHKVVHNGKTYYYYHHYNLQMRLAYLNTKDRTRWIRREAEHGERSVAWPASS